MNSFISTRIRAFRLASLLLAFVALPVLAAQPTDADIRHLLEVAHARSMVEQLVPQIDAMQEQQFNQMLQGQKLSTDQQQKLVKVKARTRQAVHQMLSWNELEPMYIDIYKKTFTRDDVLAITQFYQTPAGKALLEKTPALMQNLMVSIQQRMQPVMTSLRTDIEQIMQEPGSATTTAPKHH